jgi:copper(I)-binding protein
MKRRSFALITLLSCICGPVLLACSSDDDGATSATTGDTGELTIDAAWARTSPAMVTAGAAYVTITSPIDDRLIGASVDAAIAGSVELHQTSMADMTGTAAPAMEMVEVDAIDLPAGQTVALEPGSYHIMLLDLSQPLTLDQTFAMTLTFENAGTREVTVTVRDDAP